MSEKIKVLIDLLERHSTRMDGLGDDPRSVIIRYYYLAALWWNTRYRDVAAAQREISQMAEHLGDSRSKAYSIIGEMLVSITLAPKPLNEFELVKKEAIRVASESQDAYAQNWSWAVVCWDYLHRGRINDARIAMRELMERGRVLGDPRSTGLALAFMTWIAFFQDSYSEALEYSEQALTVAITPQDRTTAVLAKGCALVLLQQTEAGAPILPRQKGYFRSTGHPQYSRGSRRRSRNWANRRSRRVTPPTPPAAPSPPSDRACRNLP